MKQSELAASLLNALSMWNTYEERLVGRYNHSSGGIVSTVAVYDGELPYETAWAHPEYNGGAWVIVEAYATKDAAAAGHERWTDKMRAPELPEVLTECFNSAISKIVSGVGALGRTHFRKKAP